MTSTHTDHASRPGATIRRLLVDAPGSVGAGARARRWETVQELFPSLADMHVVDLGGTVEAWQRAPVRPRRVTVVNLFEPGTTDEAVLVEIQDALHDALGDRALGSWPEDGRLELQVLYDDGSLQAHLDDVYGTDVVHVRSALVDVAG